MGLSYNNLHIKKNGAVTVQAVCDIIAGIFKADGYFPCEKDDAEMCALVYAPENSGWISVACGRSEYDGRCEAQTKAADFSEALGTQVISANCCDSDFMELSISDPAGETLGRVNIGEPYGGQFTHPTNLSPWEHEVSDFGKFTELMTNSHTFAEDAFYGAAELLGMSPEQTCVTVRHAEPLDTSAVIMLYFAVPEYQTDAPPKMQYLLCNGIPFQPDKIATLPIVNIGRASKGIRFAVKMPSEGGEVWFENTALFFGNGQVGRPITLEKTQLSEDTTAFVWTDEEFPLPGAVDPQLPYTEKARREYQRCFGINLCPKGDRMKLLEARAVIYPLENEWNGNSMVRANAEQKKQLAEEYAKSDTKEQNK